MSAGEQKKIREDLIYYNECYHIVGVLLSVYNQLGYGFDEKTYQKAVAEALRIAGHHFSTAHINQLYQYLVAKNLKLGILAYFAPRGVHYKRIVNLV